MVFYYSNTSQLARSGKVGGYGWGMQFISTQEYVCLSHWEKLSLSTLNYSLIFVKLLSVYLQGPFFNRKKLLFIHCIFWQCMFIGCPNNVKMLLINTMMPPPPPILDMSKLLPYHVLFKRFTFMNIF